MLINKYVYWTLFSPFLHLFVAQGSAKVADLGIPNGKV